MRNQGTIAQIQCPEPVTERHRLTVPRLADLVSLHEIFLSFIAFVCVLFVFFHNVYHMFPHIRLKSNCVRHFTISGSSPSLEFISSRTVSAAV